MAPISPNSDVSNPHDTLDELLHSILDFNRLLKSFIATSQDEGGTEHEDSIIHSESSSSNIKYTLDALLQAPTQEPFELAPITQPSLSISPIIPRQNSGVIPTTYPDSKKGSSPGAVAGAVIGSVAGFLLILWLIQQIFNARKREVASPLEVIETREHRRPSTHYAVPMPMPVSPLPKVTYEVQDTELTIPRVLHHPSASSKRGESRGDAIARPI
jgi:hypothetical protein